jgi:hypothetical protein
MFREELKDLVEPLVLPDTPAVLSIGRRCMQMGYGFYWHPGQNPFLVTPDGNVIPLLVRKDIPYLAVGSSRSIPKRPKNFVEIPVVPAVEQIELDKCVQDEQTKETGSTISSENSGASEDVVTENIRERYPYGYTGELSEECEIPLAVLKQVYDTYGSECEDEEWDSQNVAMVVEPALGKTKESRVSPAASATDRDREISLGEASDDNKEITEPASKRRRRIEIGPVDTDDEEKLYHDTCDCGCECGLAQNVSPTQICLNCRAFLCSNCAHVGANGGVLCHCCRECLVNLRQRQCLEDNSVNRGVKKFCVMVYDLKYDESHRVVVTRYRELYETEDWYMGLTDIDHCMFECCRKDFNTMVPSNTFMQDSRARRRLFKQCEQARKNLVDGRKYSIDIVSLCQGQDYQYAVRRANHTELQEIWSPRVKVLKGIIEKGMFVGTTMSRELR